MTLVGSGPVPYHQPMAPPPFVVAVVGSRESLGHEAHTAAWVTGRDVAWSGAWLAADIASAVGAAAAAGCREHDGAVVGFVSHEYREVTVEHCDASLVVRTGLPHPLHANVLVANADALLAFRGDSGTMAAIAAASAAGVPVAQVACDQWPLRILTPTEVPAWLDEHIRWTAASPPSPDPPDPPVLDPTAPQGDTPDSGSEPPERTPSSSSTASDATSSPSPTTPTNEPASTSGTPTA